MRLDNFDYCLPEELIAQVPLAHRSASRLMVLRRSVETVSHHQFLELPQLLREGDLLVRNETRVIPARLLGRKQTGGQVEILLVRQMEGQSSTWRCMTKSSKAVRVGAQIDLPGGGLAEILSIEADGHRLVRFSGCDDFMAYLRVHGHIPLPPYISRDDQPFDRERYQTVFADQPGAVAAPTAGLHFTEETFTQLASRGIETCGITLHVGPGTFQPVRTENLREHRMHAEVYEVPQLTAEKVNAARAAGRRIVALGTTVTRTLEHAVDRHGVLQAGRGETDLFIFPGFEFRIVDALITNFHLPKSTLLVLVAAFAGHEFILRAYRQAVAEKYRFFSYGDCMLIE